MLITSEYQKLQTEFHQQRADYGVSGAKWSEHVLRIAGKLQTRDILDYGCGKQTLQKNIPFPIKQYDPCMIGFTDAPVPADIVVCGDVLEHIEPECLDDVLDDLKRLTLRAILLTVATRPAAKFLPDGRNAHLIQESSQWWLPKILARFELESFQNMGGEFVVIATPKVIE